MAENTITIRLSDDDRARLDKLTAALETLAGIVPNCDRCVKDAVRMTQAAATPAEPTEASQEPAGAQEEKPAENNTPKQDEPAVAAGEPQAPAEPAPVEPEPAKPSVTLAQIQQLVVKLAAAGKKPEVKNIITAYGSKVSDLQDQPEKWGEVWGKLTALEG